VSFRTGGALYDPNAEPRGAPVGLLGFMRTGGALPPEVDNTEHAVERVDQEDEGCVGHALGGAIDATADAAGVKIRVSQRAIYKGALQLELPHARTLPDRGSYPEKAVDWISTFGVVDRERCPEDSDITKPLGQEVLEAGSLSVVEGIYRIDETGEAQRLAVMKAINAKHFVFFAMDVDASYEDYHGGVWTGPKGELKGGHAQFAAGYTLEGLLIINSWGRTWGRNGISIIAWRHFLARCRNKYVVKLAPQVLL